MTPLTALAPHGLAVAQAAAGAAHESAAALVSLPAHIAQVLIPLESVGFVDAITDATNDGTNAVGALGLLLVMLFVITAIWGKRGALVGILMAALAGGLGYWLFKYDGLSTVAQMWDATIKQYATKK